MHIHYLIKEDGLCHYQLRVVVAAPHSFEFELRQISSWEVDEACAPIIDEAEVSASGFVKWDGCANIIFDGGGYAHFCGVNDIRRHGLALIEIYRIAHEHFLSAPDSSYAENNSDSFILEAANGAA